MSLGQRCKFFMKDPELWTLLCTAGSEAVADLGSAEGGGRFLEGAYGCAVSRGGGAYAGYVLWWLRHCRDPFYRFMVLGGGGGGGGRGLWHPHTPRKLRLGNRLYDLCAFGARLSHFPFKFTALGVINEGVGAS